MTWFPSVQWSRALITRSFPRLLVNHEHHAFAAFERFGPLAGRLMGAAKRESVTLDLVDGPRCGLAVRSQVQLHRALGRVDLEGELAADRRHPLVALDQERFRLLDRVIVL